MNERAKKLLEQLNAIDKQQRMKFINGLSSADRAEVLRFLSDEDRAKYNKFAADQAEKNLNDSRKERLDKARKGCAASPEDMVEVLLENEDRLKPIHRKWINDMDRTAGTFEKIQGYTARQEEVIRDIYSHYFRAAS